MLNIILPACLNSILPVLESEDELFLIQGKSTDQSRQISLRYQSEYPQIKVLNQNGQGLSNARNCGLYAAVGDMVLFVDSDDFIETATLQKLLCSWEDWNDCQMSWWQTSFVIMINWDKTANWANWATFHKRAGRIACHFEETHVFLECMEKSLPKRVLDRTWAVVSGKHLCRRCRLYDTGVSRKTRTMDGRCSVLLLSNWTEWIFDECNFSYQSKADCWSSGEECPETAWGQYCVEPILVGGFQFEYILNLALIQELPKEQRREATALFKHYRQVILPTKDRSVRQVATFMQLFGVSFTAKILAAAKWMKRKRERRTP